MSDSFSIYKLNTTIYITSCTFFAENSNNNNNLIETNLRKKWHFSFLTCHRYFKSTDASRYS